MQQSQPFQEHAWLIWLTLLGSGASSAPAAEKPAPEFIDHRIKIYDELKAQYLEELAKKPKNPIKVTLPDGKEVDATSWESTPYDVAKGISQGLADNTVIARVNNELWDLDRPLEGDCKLQLLKFDDPDAQAVFWHSSAHILGEAMEKVRMVTVLYGMIFSFKAVILYLSVKFQRESMVNYVHYVNLSWHLSYKQD